MESSMMRLETSKYSFGLQRDVLWGSSSHLCALMHTVATEANGAYNPRDCLRTEMFLTRVSRVMEVSIASGVSRDWISM